MKHLGRNIIIALLIAIVSALFVVGEGQATAGESTVCPQDDAGGVVCTGPTIPATIAPCAKSHGSGVVCSGPVVPEQLADSQNSVLPVGTSVDDSNDDEERPCPLPVGEGVICTGPDVPEDYPPGGQSGQADEMVPVSYLPLVRS